MAIRNWEGSGFSRREKQIVNALLQAAAIKDIASDLRLSVNTVKDYLKTIYQKARVHSARELMVKLYLEPDAEARRDVAVLDFLGSLQRLLDAGRTSELRKQLEAGVLASTQAQRVTCWKVEERNGDVVLVGEGVSAPRIPAGDFLRGILKRGWGNSEGSRALTSDERRMSRLGLSGEVMGIRFADRGNVYLIMAGEPREGRFTAQDVMTVRVLARLAESLGDHCAPPPVPVRERAPRFPSSV